MKRERQSKVEPRMVKGAQSAFDFAPEAAPAVQPAAVAGRRSTSKVPQEPRGKQTEPSPLPAQTEKRKPAAKQRKTLPVAEKDTGLQKATVATGRKSRPVVSTSEVSGPVAAVVAPVAKPSVKQRPQRKVRSAHVATVDVQPISAIEPAAPLVASQMATTAPQKEKQTARPRVRQAKAQTLVVPAPQTPQLDTQPQPRTEVKKRASKAVAAAKADDKPSISAVQKAHVPAATSDSLTAVAPQAQPVTVAAPVAPPTWRYVGAREEADRLYRRRFGTEDVPEPMMIAGTWAYALPAMRRPLA